MKILLTGANGYIGLRLLPALLQAGHEVVCLVRDRRRFPADSFQTHLESGGQLHIIEGDLLDRESLQVIPPDIDAAYYLVHSMGSQGADFPRLEEESARNFLAALEPTTASQIVYLGGLINDAPQNLSSHLASRLNVEEVLRSGSIPVTVLRAAIIVGAGSASFEIMRDLVEKLPVMVAPKWLRTKCQPISIRNVVDYLVGVLDHPDALGRTFDIGGSEVFTYQELLLTYAKVRNLRRFVIPVPLLTPRLSSYWLYFVTSTSFPLARSLVDSLTHDMTCAENAIQDVVDLDLLSFEDSVARAFSVISERKVPSSWIDSLSTGKLNARFLENAEVPRHAVLTDVRTVEFDRDPEEVRLNIWRIGGKRGWYSADWAWQLRGWIDRLVGGTGLRRGRRDPEDLRPGDALDFWRVLIADREQRRLVLFAEMKLPGEAWLEFRIEPMEEGQKWRLQQTATFRPRGLLGRAYWYTVLPVHHLVFQTMAREIVERANENS